MKSAEKTSDQPNVAAFPAGLANAKAPASRALETGGHPAAAKDRRLRGMVDAYLDVVARVLRNAGTPPGEIDDQVQCTFITAARRLDDVQPGSEKAFLIQIALYGAAHARRTVARRREVFSRSPSDLPTFVDPVRNPEQLLDQRQLRQMLDRILDQMKPELRLVFVLFELEELTSAEVAEVLRIPAGTVASRLRRARAVFRAAVLRLQGPTGVHAGVDQRSGP